MSNKMYKLKLRHGSDKNSLLDLKRCFHSRGINLNNRSATTIGIVVLAAVTAWRSGPLGRSAQTTLPTFDKYVSLPMTFDGRVDGEIV